MKFPANEGPQAQGQAGGLLDIRLSCGSPESSCLIYSMDNPEVQSSFVWTTFFSCEHTTPSVQKDFEMFSLLTKESNIENIDQEKGES